MWGDAMNASKSWPTDVPTPTIWASRSQSLVTDVILGTGLTWPSSAIRLAWALASSVKSQ